MKGRSSGENTYNVSQPTDKDEQCKERGYWSGRLDFILSCLGTAVGLGNLWRFPYVCYKNGGGAFLIPYLIMITLVGIPIFLVELTLAQYSALDPVKLFYNLCPCFKGIGYAVVICAASVALYYNMIIAWTLFYFFDSFRSVLKWQFCNNWFNTNNCFNEYDYLRCKENSTNVFFNRTCFNYTFALSNGIVDIPVEDRVSAPEEYLNHYMLKKSKGIDEIGDVEWTLALCLLLAWVIVMASLIKGIQTSGKVVYFTATFPYVVLLIFFIKGLTLEGYEDGLKFYLTPNFTKLAEIEVWKAAAVQVFYSFSVGGGGVITYASYNRFNNNLIRDVLVIGIADTLTSVFGGMVVFMMMGFMAKQLGKSVSDVTRKGTALAFVIYPEGISRMSGSVFWAILFFFMLILLGVDSQFAMIETIITPIFDHYPKTRKAKPVVVTIVGIILFLLGLPLATRAGDYILELMDEYAAGWPYLLVGLLECLVVPYVYGVERFLSDLKTMTNWDPSRFVKYFTVAVIAISTPFILAVLLITEWIEYKPLPFPVWANAIGFVIALIPISCIPIGMVHEIFKKPPKGSFLQHIKMLSCSTEKWEAHAKERKFEDVRNLQKELAFQGNSTLEESSEPQPQNATDTTF